MRTSHALACLALATLAACDPEPVGLRCDLGEPARPGETVITSGSLDCTSRLCLRAADSTTAGGNTIGMCTETCERDDDCVGDPTTPCDSGFTCAAPVAVGPFGCEKMCVCADDLLNAEPLAACQ